MEKLIITAAVCGAEATRKDSPHLPITPEEIAGAAVDAGRAGASIIHLHVRDNNGNPTQNKQVFSKVIALIQADTDLIIQVSTGGSVGMSIKERMQPLFLKPEMATLTTGSVNFGKEVFLNSPEDIENLAVIMRENNVKPEIEVFDVGMIENAIRMVKNEIIDWPLHFDLVLGVNGGIPASPKNLLHLVETLPTQSTWSAAGIGRYQLPIAVMAMLMGGHVRVGLEDNLFYRKGVLAESSAQLTARIVRLAAELEREIASPCDARRILSLPQKLKGM